MPDFFSLNSVNGVASSVITLVIAAVPIPSAVAQVSSNEIGYFSRCRNIRDINARVSCYDDLYDRALRAAAPRNDPSTLMEENRRMREELARIRGQAGSATAASPGGDSGIRNPYPATGRNEPYPATGAVEEFGKKEPRVVKNEDGEEILYDRIAALRKIPDGWVITLESGQVWRQTVSRRYALREGQEVKISPSQWGSSYRLVVSQLGGFIRVERIQ